MKAFAEFRIPERYAQEFLSPTVGRTFDGFARQMRVSVGSSVYKQIGELENLILEREGKHFFLGWTIERRYTEEELMSAELLILKITKAFEPAGEECGTVYDFTSACKVCGSGFNQVSELFLDLHTIPKHTDITRTISDEIIINPAFNNALTENGKGGYKLRSVQHRSSNENSRMPNVGAWQQLIPSSQVDMSPLTKTGNNPFNEDLDNEYRCPLGHTAGLSVISELFLYRDSWDGSDVVATKQLFGVNRGFLRTFPIIAISRSAYQRLLQAKCRGYTVEVVHLVD
jgi:hypothetical protein